MRSDLKSDFENLILNSIDKYKILDILIVGGSQREPELELLKSRNLNIRCTFLGINKEDAGSDTFIYQDLNIRIASNFVTPKNFDLVLCCGVIEHLWNLEAFFFNLSALVQSDSKIWITFPVFNFPHGAPDWYSSGYSPDMLAKIADLYGFITLKSGARGNLRDYRFRSLLKIWPENLGKPEKYFFMPLLSYFPTPGSILKKLYFQFSTIPTRIILQLSSSKISSKLENATEGFIFLTGRVKS